MPVLLWSERDGVRATEVRTGRPVRLSAEELRPEAEALDPKLDALLDDALALLAEGAGDAQPTPLLKAWVLGRAVACAGVLQDAALRGEVREVLWQALAHKCWYGLRADGKHEKHWRLLRSTSERRVNPPQAATNQFRHEDFEIGLWLQEQEYDDAVALFNGMMRNAQELFRHPAQRHANVRHAILHWLSQQPTQLQRRLMNTREFRAIPKALAKRFPSSGPGSALLPQHIDEEALRRIVVETLDARFYEDQP